MENLNEQNQEIGMMRAVTRFLIESMSESPEIIEFTIRVAKQIKEELGV